MCEINYTYMGICITKQSFTNVQVCIFTLADLLPLCPNKIPYSWCISNETEHSHTVYIHQLTTITVLELI